MAFERYCDTCFNCYFDNEGNKLSSPSGIIIIVSGLVTTLPQYRHGP